MSMLRANSQTPLAASSTDSSVKKSTQGRYRWEGSSLRTRVGSQPQRQPGPP